MLNNLYKKSEEGKNPSSKHSNQRKSGTGKAALPGEASIQHIKCFKGKVKGHIAKDCPEVF